MDRRAMELLYGVAEVSTTKLPRSEESEEEEQGMLAAIPIVGSATATAASGVAPEPVQAQLAEWVTRWDELMGELYMITISGKELLVPKLGDGLQLARDYHERIGHCERLS
ncbi:hypothetical protein CYMTET_25998 [Cymbomonas tetramitiformis]|uniref:Uncharacterized protein n=1 Tax=Cymbomonas tetramitiformis TaxID=36881 RepID=A0AAE0KYH5_9CHLO|nr:hypothetical protein CYMTET_25998 [Cymbomonas tetramitiformis]